MGPATPVRVLLVVAAVGVLALSAPADAATPAPDCLSRPVVTTVAGAFTTQYKQAPPPGSTVDARAASWTMPNGYLMTPAATTGVCFLGGRLALTVDDTVSTATYTATPTNAWAQIWHRNGGVTLKNGDAGWVLDGLAVSHVGDAIALSTGAQGTEIRAVHLSDVRDDCVQDDLYLAVDVHDSFLDGCYVAFSAKASSTTAPDGHLNTFSVTNNVVRVQPMWSVYKGDSPGNGEIFKWDSANPGRTPHLVFRGNVVRVGRTPFQVGTKQGKFFVPPDADVYGNVLVWDGPGTPPASLAQWFDAAHGGRIGTLADWDAAVAAWRAAHPGVA